MTVDRAACNESDLTSLSRATHMAWLFASFSQSQSACLLLLFCNFSLLAAKLHVTKIMDGDDGEWVWVRRLAEPDATARWTAATAAVELEDEDDRGLKVVFAAPAPRWTDAAPLGNGRLGAMVWGGVTSETIQLNRNIHYAFVH